MYKSVFRKGAGDISVCLILLWLKALFSLVITSDMNQKSAFDLNFIT